LTGLLFVEVSFRCFAAGFGDKNSTGDGDTPSVSDSSVFDFGSDGSECAAKDLEAYSSAWPSRETISVDRWIFCFAQLLSDDYLSAVFKRLQRSRTVNLVSFSFRSQLFDFVRDS
jgi:hypothetical protein